MKKQVVQYAQLDQLNLCMTFYSQQIFSSAKATILYLHGGGLLYGNRDDLPTEVIELFLKNGYNLLTIDYPLAPEVKLPTIYACLEQAVDWFQANYQKQLKIKTSDYFLFGRSAGGYLAYLLSARHRCHKQKGLISFYSYYELTLPELNQPSPYYQKFSKVSPLEAQALIRSAPFTAASINERFSLYLSGRQFGNWLNYCLASIPEKRNFSLTENELLDLPPTFLTHSVADQDIPVHSSRNAARKIPFATYKEIEKLPHDFDNNLTHPESLQLYHNVICWMNGVQSL